MMNDNNNDNNDNNNNNNNINNDNNHTTMLYRKSSYLKVFAQGLRKVSRKRIKKCRASPQGHAQGPCARAK